MSQKLSNIEKEWLLSFASDQSDITHVKSLLQKHPELKATKTALHWAAKNGRLDMVDFLLAQGLSPEIRTGYTPLHLATMHNHNGVILLLIDDYGASIDARDNSGKRPKDYIKRNATPSVKSKLQRLDSSASGNGEKPLANISNMFQQLCSVSPPDVDSEGNTVFLSPFFLPPNPETNAVRKNSTTRLSRVYTTFRKVRPKLRKTARVSVDDGNIDTEKKTGSSVPMENKPLDFTGASHRQRTRSEPNVRKLIKEIESELPNETTES